MTSRKQHLAEEAENFFVLAEGTDRGVLVLDQEGSVLYSNGYASDFTGFTSEELKKAGLDVFQGLDAGMLEEFRDSSVLECSIIRKDGRQLNVTVRVKDASWEGRRASLLILTDKAEVEGNSLRESEAKYGKLLQEFHTMMDAMPDTLVLLTPSLEVLWANKGAKAVLRDEEKSQVSRRCYSLWLGNSEPCYRCPALKSFSSGESESAQLTTGDGRIWEVRTFPLRDEDGSIRRVMETATDITEKMALQADAIRTRHLASIGELAAGVAHEINNPINGIINYAQILLNSAEQGSREHDISARIIKEGDRIADIVRSLLSFARGSRKDKIPISVKDTLSESISLVGALLRKDSIKLQLHIPEGLPDIIADQPQIQQVFLNIINNARFALNRKFSEPDPDKVLEIGAETVKTKGKPFVRVIFLDRGTGISEALLDKVMNPFFTTRSGRGTGLGLSISHGIVTEHGGSIRVQSKEGQFTSVVIELPARN